MFATFIELPPFERFREDYLDDRNYRLLQLHLLENPAAGDTIAGTGGLRKLRWGDETRGKGKRGGVRIIYYWFDGQRQFWFFTLYDKDEMSDLSQVQKKTLRTLLMNEKANRRQ